MAGRGFETRSVTLGPALLLTFQAPPADIERIMGAVVEIVPLAVGNCDNNAFQFAPGVERYRPLQGAAAGPETELRKRPGIVEVSFELPDDGPLLERVVEVIFVTHSYEEPVIRIQTILSSRSKGLDDSDNPHRWWNTGGDWKTTGGSDADQAEAR